MKLHIIMHLEIDGNWWFSFISTYQFVLDVLQKPVEWFFFLGG